MYTNIFSLLSCDEIHLGSQLILYWPVNQLTVDNINILHDGIILQLFFSAYHKYINDYDKSNSNIRK